MEAALQARANCFSRDLWPFLGWGGCVTQYQRVKKLSLTPTRGVNARGWQTHVIKRWVTLCCIRTICTSEQSTLALIRLQQRQDGWWELAGLEARRQLNAFKNNSCDINRYKDPWRPRVLTYDLRNANLDRRAVAVALIFFPNVFVMSCKNMRWRKSIIRVMSQRTPATARGHHPSSWATKWSQSRIWNSIHLDYIGV